MRLEDVPVGSLLRTTGYVSTDSSGVDSRLITSGTLMVFLGVVSRHHVATFADESKGVDSVVRYRALVVGDGISIRQIVQHSYSQLTEVGGPKVSPLIELVCPVPPTAEVA